MDTASCNLSPGHRRQSLAPISAPLYSLGHCCSAACHHRLNSVLFLQTLWQTLADAADARQTPSPIPTTPTDHLHSCNHSCVPSSVACMRVYSSVTIATDHPRPHCRTCQHASRRPCDTTQDVVSYAFQPSLLDHHHCLSALCLLHIALDMPNRWTHWLASQMAVLVGGFLALHELRAGD